MKEHQGYTPGPWHYQEDADAYTHIARGPHGEYVLSGPQGSSGRAEADIRLASDAPTLYEENVALRSQVVRMREALEMIEGHLDADNEESYRADDPEGAMDTCFAMARTALEPKP